MEMNVLSVLELVWKIPSLYLTIGSQKTSSTSVCIYVHIHTVVRNKTYTQSDLLMKELVFLMFYGCFYCVY